MTHSFQPPIDLHALRAFVMVGRTGNITRAAQRLHRSQPAISLQIKTLNEAVGLTLLQRTPQGMELTADGAALLPLAEKVLGAVGDFASTAAALNRTIRGTLRVGTILDPGFTRLGAFLLRLATTCPQIHTVLQQHTSGAVLLRLERGDLDVGFFLNPPGEPLPGAIINRTLTRFTYRVLAPTGWEAKVHGKDWKSLAALPWLQTPRTSVHHRLLERVFGPRSLTGIEPNWTALVDQESSMLDLVRSGMGLSLVRESIATHESRTGGLAMADKVALDCELSLLYRAELATDPVVMAALDALDEVWDPDFILSDQEGDSNAARTPDY